VAEPAIIYLDVDDEITAAAARIRAAEPSHIAIVIPPGSHIPTSRINFRLLAREAQARNRRLSIVAPDAASRAIAVSAGLDAHASVGAFEAALAAGRDAPPLTEEASEPRDGGAAPAAAAVTAAAVASAASGIAAAPTPKGPTPVTSAESARTTRPADVPTEPVTPTGRPRPAPSRASTVVAPGRPSRSRVLLAGALALAGVLVAGAIAAAIYLPTATIEVTPRPEAVGPVELTVSADPAATEVDAAGGIVPATTVDFPISVTQTFEATGERVEETRATGAVTFDSVNTVGPVAVESGTRVSTLGGTVFSTTRDVMVPKATVAGTTIKHGTVSVPVRATRAGPDGNVDAGEITQVPDFLSTQQVSVNNGSATKGGSRTEHTLVTQKDVDAATKALEVEVAKAFAADVAASEGVPTELTLFPATATLGPVTYDPNPAGLIEDEVETFELTANATGKATAVDVAQVGQVAETRLDSSVAPGATLVPDSVDIATGDPTITGAVVTFPVTASARQVRPLDAEALKAEVLGLPLAEAESILERSGAVTITLWPGFTNSIPSIDSRVTLTVGGDVTPSVAPSSVPS
jgi:hypothetical protein